MAEREFTQSMILTASHLQNLADRMTLRALKDGPGGDIAMSARVLRWLILAGYVVESIVLPPLFEPGGPAIGTGIPEVTDASHHSG